MAESSLTTSGGPLTFPSPGPVSPRDSLDVHLLVTYLRAESRDRPVVVLTLGKGEAAPYVSPDDLVATAGGRADVVILRGDDLTRRFAESVATRAGVYRGACRVYPPGTTWETDPRSVPLRMARDEQEIASLPGLVRQDLTRALERKPLRPATRPATAPGRVPPAPAVRPVTGPPAPPVPPVAVPSAAGSPARPAPVAQTPLPETITTEAEAAALGAYLLGDRVNPVVVVSRATGEAAAYADVDQLRSDLTGLADVFEITSLKASWAFTRTVPPLCQVYGGAGRVYAAGNAWVHDPYSSHLRLAYGRQEGAELTRALIADAMRLASRGGYAARPAPTPRGVVTGTVIGTAGGRGIVQLKAGGAGVLWPELTEPDLPAERLFATGMVVTGEFDPESRRIDIRGMRLTPAEAVAAYEPGDTVLVRVAEVSAETCTVDLWPGQTVAIAPEDVSDDPELDLRDVMTVGETVPALVVAHDSGTGEWLVSLVEAEEAAQAVPAPPVLQGGPPWLVPPVLAPPVIAAARGEPVPFARLDVDNEVVLGLQLENQQLVQLIKEMTDQLAAAQAQLTLAKTGRRENLRRRASADRQSVADQRAAGDQSLFLDEADQLDFEIRLAWARMVAPGDKAIYPLKAWRYGEAFFATLREIQGVSRDKVVEVIVHVLTGRDSELASRQLHQLRSSISGNAPPRTRAGGEVCWRVSLQHRTPSARRLHYWVCNDGAIELASIRNHDDMEA